MDISKADLNLLKVFLVLSDELNVTRAAERLNLSQSAVSASLKRLREMYNDPLFKRAQVGMVPTSKALKMRPLIEEAINQIKTTLNSTEQLNHFDKSRVITIGLSDDFELTYGRQILNELTELAPNFSIVFQQTNSHLVEEALLTRRIDISLSGGGLKDSRLKSSTVGQAGYLCIYDKNLRNKKQPLSLEEFVALEHLLISFSGVTGAVDDVLKELGLKRTVKVSTSHFSAIPFFLDGSRLVATIPDFAAKELATNNKFHICDCPISMPSFSIEIGWRGESTMDVALLEVRDTINNIVSKSMSLK